MALNRVWWLVAGVVLAMLAGCQKQPEVQLERARIALSHNRPDQALELAQAVLRNEPSQAEARQIIAQSQLRLNQLDPARELLDALMAESPENVELHRMMVQWAFQSMTEVFNRSDFLEDESQLLRYQQAAELARDHAGWLEREADLVAEACFIRANLAEREGLRLNLLIGRMTDVLQSQRLGESLTSERMQARRQQLEQQVRQQQELAASEFERCVASDPRHFAAAQMYARLLTLRKAWPTLWELTERMAQQSDLPPALCEQLVKSLAAIPPRQYPMAQRLARGWALQEQVAANHRSTHRWQLTSGRLHLLAGDLAKAESMLQRAHQRNQRDEETRYLLARTLQAQGKTASAKAVLDQLAVDVPQSAQVQTLYGVVLTQAGQYALAREALRRAIELNPDDVAAREAMVGLMAREGHLAAAEADISDFLHRHPDNAAALRMRYQVLHRQSDRPEIDRLLTQVAAIQPAEIEHLNLLCEGYAYLHRYDQVARYAARLVDRQPDVLEHYLTLAEACMQLGRLDEVEQVLQQAGEHFADAAGVDLLRAQLLIRLHRYDQAMVYLNRLLTQDPQHDQARQLLAQSLMGLAMFDDALDQLRVLLEANPGDAQLHAMIARIYTLQGDLDAAHQHLSLIDRDQIDQVRQPAVLAQVHLAMDDVQTARDICEQALAIGHTDPMLRLLLAHIHQRQGEIPQAEMQLISLVRSQPGSAQAFSLLTGFYAGQNQHQRGVMQMQRLAEHNEVLARVSQASLLMGAHDPKAAREVLTPIQESLVRRRDSRAWQVTDLLARILVLENRHQDAMAVYQALIDTEHQAQRARLAQIDLAWGRQQPQDLLGQLTQLANSLTLDHDVSLHEAVVGRMVQLGHHQNAVDQVGRWLADRPDHAPLLALQADLYQQTGQLDQAASQLEKATAIWPQSIPLRLQLARLHRQRHDFPAAEAVYQQAAQLGTGARLAAMTELAQMFVQLGLSQQAAAVFEQLVGDQQPRDPRLLLAMGQAYQAMGRSLEAASLLEAVPRFSVQYAQAQVELARIEQRQGQPDQARQRLAELASHPRTAAPAAREMLRMDLNNRRDEQLMQWIDQALSAEHVRDREKRLWLRMRLSTAANREDWSLALDSAIELGKLEPDNLRLGMAQVMLCLIQDDRQQALSIVKAYPMLSRSPLAVPLAMLLRMPQAHNAPQPVGIHRVLVAALEQNRPGAAQAVEQLPAMHTIFREDLYAWLDRYPGNETNRAGIEELLAAMICLDADLPQAARVYAQKAAARWPDAVLPQAVKAQIRLARGQPIAPVAERLNDQQDSELKQYLKARTHIQAGRYEHAAVILEQMIQREPTHLYLKQEMVGLLQAQGRVDDAIQWLEAMASQQDNRLTVINDLAYLLAKHHPQRLADAARLAEQALALAPDHPAVRNTVGWIRHLQGDQQQAISHLAQALAGLGQSPSVQFHAGMVYRELGQTAWARYCLKQAAASDKDIPEVQTAREVLTLLVH